MPLSIAPPLAPEEPDDLNTLLNNLVKAAVKGDSEAEKKLYAIVADWLGGMAWRFGFLPAAGPDDMLQEAKKAIFDGLPTFDPAKGRFRAWSTTLAWRKMRDVLSKNGLPRGLHENVMKVRDARDKFLHEEGRRPSILELADFSGLTEKQVNEALNASAIVQAESIEELSAAGCDVPNSGEPLPSHDLEEMRRCLDKLSPEERAIIDHFYFTGLSHKEIAEKLRISEGNSRVKLNRATDKLRRLMGASPAA